MIALESSIRQSDLEHLQVTRWPRKILNVQNWLDIDYVSKNSGRGSDSLLSRLFLLCASIEDVDSPGGKSRGRGT